MDAAPITLVCPHCSAINRLAETRLAAGPRCGACHAPVFEGRPLALDEAGFRRHLAHDGVPLLVDFWASWCGPCRAMAPQFEAAARSLEPQFRLAKVSTEEAPALAQSLNITGIPALLLFRGGREVARQAGALAAGQIAAWARQKAGGQAAA
ncbi:thiol reductase thioredoxin [Pseudoroseomonas deserti]|uniref:Thiol reductase thioredoxin n=1 Tax=Teichococcus deserti TaxID=1817963 RepID=A0A1V2GVY3_9PROT|nr:thioredoxin domain-containing protein [Pseudoroseomonas deserti]ONG47299.1 thiol reductase thioredoxin [Pseudoroseomonas deserti]